MYSKPTTKVSSYLPYLDYFSTWTFTEGIYEHVYTCTVRVLSATFVPSKVQRCTTGSTSGSTSGSIQRCTSVLSRAPSYVHVIVRVHVHVQYNGVVYVDKKKFILIVLSYVYVVHVRVRKTYSTEVRKYFRKYNVLYGSTFESTFVRKYFRTKVQLQLLPYGSTEELRKYFRIITSGSTFVRRYFRSSYILPYKLLSYVHSYILHRLHTLRV